MCDVPKVCGMHSCIHSCANSQVVEEENLKEDTATYPVLMVAHMARSLTDQVVDGDRCHTSALGHITQINTQDHER